MNYDPTSGTLWLHQSDINSYITCPEAFRVQNGILPNGNWEPARVVRVENDAATVGTVLHAVIEHELVVEPFPTVNLAIKCGKEKFGDLLRQYLASEVEYRTESFGEEPDRPLKELELLVRQWYQSPIRQELLLLLGEHPKDILVEWSFDVPFLERPNDDVVRAVRLAGQADIVDRYTNRMIDWKSSGREYKRWEKQRWAVQPTVYTYAAHREGLITPFEQGCRFDYGVFIRRGKESQQLTVWRSFGQWEWLARLCDNIATMFGSPLTQWPLRDDHALCGPKWCANWSECKGQFIEEDWT